jgi:hypothetical protein
MKLKTVLASLVLGASLLLASCSPSNPPDQGPPIVKQFDRGAKTIQLRVVTHSSHRELTQAKIKFEKGKPSPLLYGWSAWSKDEPGQCELHVKEATHYRDVEFETWGHELAHCLYGNFHDEPIAPVSRLSK